MAIWKALKYCLLNSIYSISLETDSKGLRNMILRIWRIPWELVERIEDIQNMMEQMNVQIIHIFREANLLADYITNLAINIAEKVQLQHFSQLPSMGRRLINMDKQQIPNIRIRTRYI